MTPAVEVAVPYRGPALWDDADRAVIEFLRGERVGGTDRIAQPVAGVPPGWDSESWARRLEQVAEACEQMHPVKAAEHRQQTSEIRQRMRG